MQNGYLEDLLEDKANMHQLPDEIKKDMAIQLVSHQLTTKITTLGLSRSIHKAAASTFLVPADGDVHQGGFVTILKVTPSLLQKSKGWDYRFLFFKIV